jgi:RNA recognition motif-containing protein
MTVSIGLFSSYTLHTQCFYYFCSDFDVHSSTTIMNRRDACGVPVKNDWLATCGEEEERKSQFTVFVKNIPFSLTHDLNQTILSLVRMSFDTEIKIVGSRIAVDKTSGKSLGYGFVEVASIDEVRKTHTMSNIYSLLLEMKSYPVILLSS